MFLMWIILFRTFKRYLDKLLTETNFNCELSWYFIPLPLSHTPNWICIYFYQGQTYKFWALLCPGHKQIGGGVSTFQVLNEKRIKTNELTCCWDSIFYLFWKGIFYSKQRISFLLFIPSSVSHTFERWRHLTRIWLEPNLFGSILLGSDMGFCDQ